MSAYLVKSCPFGHDCPQCRLWVRLRGQNPQSGQEMDREDCALAWLPILLVENSQRQWQTSQAVESFRNDMTSQQAHLQAALVRALEAPKCLE